MVRFKHLSALALLSATLAGTALAADTTATVKGIVNDADGKPVAKALVKLLHRDGSKLEVSDSASSDAEGAFAFGKVEDGTYVILAESRDHKFRDRTELTVHDGKDPTALSFNLKAGKEPAKEEAAAVKAEKPHNRVNFVGVVVDKKKQPVVGAIIKLLDASSNSLDSVTSEAKGRFEFYKVALGKYTLDVTNGSAHTQQDITLADTDGTQSIEVHLK